jgi:hypothetical protein
MKTIITGTLIIGILFLLLGNGNVLAQEEKSQQNNLAFEVQGLRTDPLDTTTPKLKDFQITGKIWDNICPSNQCQIKSDESTLRGKVPIPNPDTDPYIDPSIAVTMSFDLHDNVTNKDLTPTQKKLEERYQAQFICTVDRFKDIIKQENNTIYKCSSHLSTLQREYPDEENG